MKMLKQLIQGLKLTYKFSHIDDEDIIKIIVNHSLGAAAAAVASGWLPGVGGAVATGVAMGFVLSMYYRLCEEMNIKLSKNKLKAIASVAIAEIAAYLAVIMAAEAVLTLIPGLNIGAALIAAVCNFGMVYVAGALFIKMMIAFTSGQNDVSSMSEDQLKKAMKEEADKDTIEKIYKESKKTYNDTKNNSKYDKNDSSSMS